MRKKIIGLFVIIMLTMPIVSALDANKTNNKRIENSNMNEHISIELYESSNSIGINLDIENIGDTILNNIEWSFRSKPAITGTGFFIREKLQEGIIEEIAAGEKITLEFRPFGAETKSPIGLGNIYMNASVEVNDVSVRTEKRAFILLFFLLNYKQTYMDIKPAAVSYTHLRAHET